MIRAVIIDDEINGINALKLLLADLEFKVSVVASATDPIEAIALITNYKPDLVFLDIMMPRMNGFELLEKLNFHDFKLVFTTAHAEYAIRAIKEKAYDYLLKPIDRDDLEKCITNICAPAVAKAMTSHVKFIELAVRDGIIFIRPDEIVRLEASGSYTVFFLEKDIKHIASRSMKEYEMQLDPQKFFRCHISHIVNLMKVKKLVTTDGLYLQMEDGSLPEVARKNKTILVERLKNI